MATEYRLIANTDAGGENHLAELIALGARADELVVASPFVGQDLGFLLDGLPRLEKITLITALNGFGLALAAVPAIRALLVQAEARGIELELRICERSHAKAYLFYRRGLPEGFVVSSANLTEKGMVGNFELGIGGKDPSAQDALRRQLEGLRFDPMTERALSRYERKREEWLREHGAGSDVFVAAGQDDAHWAALASPADGRRFWLDTFGVPDDQYKGPYAFSPLPLGFSERMAATSRRIRKGDIVILHRVHSKWDRSIGNRLVGAFEITDDFDPVPRPNDTGDDWCYKRGIRCVTPSFSSCWYDLPSVRIGDEDLCQRFSSAKPDTAQTVNKDGSRGARAFNRIRQSCFELTPEFAEFLLGEMERVACP